MIGIVISVRDQAQYLGEALDSIEAQTRAPDQVVIVDNGSSDGSGELARSRGYATILGPGAGPSVARNLGVAQLETEFLTVFDADDRLTPRHNELLLAAIGSADAVAGQVRQFYDPGREVELAALHRLDERLPGGVPGAMLLRRSAFDRLGGFTEDRAYHEFFALVHGVSPYEVIDEIVLERRVHGANRSIVDREEMRAAYLNSARAAILASKRGPAQEPA